MDTLPHIPARLFTQEQRLRSLDCVGSMLSGAEVRLQLSVLRCMEHLLADGGEEAAQCIRQYLPVVMDSNESSVRFLYGRLCAAMGEPQLSDLPVPASQLYLSNLKNAVHWSIKVTHIDVLCDDVVHHPETAFHTAMHLSNLLSVSEHLPVRIRAGQGLLQIADYLTVDQQNEIVVDLLRELETGQEEVSRYIPEYLGALLCRLPLKEFEEGFVFLEDFVRSGGVASARAALRTLGVILTDLARAGRADTPLVTRVFGLLLTGVAHYNDTIHQAALSILCRDVLGSDDISLEVRRSTSCALGRSSSPFWQSPAPAS